MTEELQFIENVIDDKELQELINKLEDIQEEIFFLNMIDRWDDSDYALFGKLSEQERDIKKQIEEIKKRKLDETL